LIALFGVVVTIRYNARKARELEEFKLALQGKTSSKALIAELSEYENGLKQTIDHLQKTQEMLTNIGAPPDPEGWVELPTYSFSKIVYREAVKQVGILTDDVVIKVVEAYSKLENLSSQILFLYYPEIPKNDPKMETITFIPYTLVPEAITVYSNLLATVYNAIKVVEKSLGTPRGRHGRAAKAGVKR
jgi:hypothetical protein